MRQKPRILVVEDEPIVGLEISDSLERMGYSVCPVVSSGDKVLEAALRENPDLILMDIKLKSFTDGIDASVRVKMVKNTPVIYMTAFSDIGMRAERTNPAAYLLKPVENDILKREIDAALGIRPKQASNPAGDPHPYRR
jgi:DNA-binding response OmpR family regulator